MELGLNTWDLRRTKISSLYILLICFTGSFIWILDADAHGENPDAQLAHTRVARATSFSKGPQHPQRGRTGGYQRTYTETKFETQAQASLNQTIVTSTNLRLEKQGISGSHILNVKNFTSYPGRNFNESSEYNNITFIGQSGTRTIPDNVHPLTRLTEQALSKQGRNPARAYVPNRPHPCEQRSCYPATGNLLIGRETNLSATSTCGLRGEERFCIVSHLEDKKKCFRCDSRDRHVNNPGLSHRIDNILHRFYPGSNERRSWWQSENGIEHVSIQLDLEAEFHFTHMIITFKTFRPAAMLIERSWDFGKTWKVYRYFANNCTESFPNAYEGPFTSINDVICETRYSNVNPSTEGEVIFRVLPKNVEIPDPYADDVQNLLKITNLRVNFTKLHTLGDDLLDRRQEIQEKYYYSIYEMVVRGSCSCYGHASRCLPQITSSGSPYVYTDPNMVHGRCECTHNTKGLNCEECEDFYFDLPWKPAIGRQSNACKRCNCNGHATSCKFNEDVYIRSGNVSGGVCENCMHFTKGNKCDQCIDGYYHHPTYPNISHEQACQKCECDGRGTLTHTSCDAFTDTNRGMIAGKCHCKEFVTGQLCDQCKPDYWNMNENNPDGCEKCSCNLQGTRGNQGCHPQTGECTCKTYVTGRDCNQCRPEFWGLSEDPEGCKPCECDVGGAYDNNCDVLNGKCRCRPNVRGRNCSTPEDKYFAPNMTYLTYEAEAAKISPNTQIVVREPFRDGRPPTWTGTGFVRCAEQAYLEFEITDLVTSMEYDLIINYETPSGWHRVNVLTIPDRLADPDGPCANAITPSGPTTVVLARPERRTTVYPPLCLENGTRIYTVRLEIESSDPPQTPVLIDSIEVIPRPDAIPFFHGSQPNEYAKQEYDWCNSYAQSGSPLPPQCQKLLTSVGYYIFNGAMECNCNVTGSTSLICDSLGGQCPCKPNVVGRMCDRCAAGTYGFGPDGCKACDCSPKGALDNFCDKESGQCRCKPNAYGLQCGECQPGFYRFPECIQCNCHGHADICEQDTGKCISCRDQTAGDYCETCVEGFFGDPRIGVGIECRSCHCPGIYDGDKYFATRCRLDRYTNDVICDCKDGYAGTKCDSCAKNHYRNPITGTCDPCNCNNNVPTEVDSCDKDTGDCFNCLYNTAGASCDICSPGYYGDASQRTCQECKCNLLGTNGNKSICNHITGECDCLPNVNGTFCDQCIANHWKLASGEGCEACDCDPKGSRGEQCHLYTGLCDCKDGFGGRKCDQCEAYFWGDPSLALCYPCECNPRGSADLQCDRTNGSCTCIQGIGGHKCNECARGYIGSAPSCSPCGECFENWDRIIQELKDQTNRVVNEASEIKQQGTTGAYSREFETMQTRIDEVKKLLKSSNVSSQDLEELQNLINMKREIFETSTKDLDIVGKTLDEISQSVLIKNATLGVMEGKVEALQNSSNVLKDKAINLQESNVEGALNLTKEAKRRSDEAVRKASDVSGKIQSSKHQKQRIDSLLTQISPSWNKSLEQISDDLGKVDNKLRDINDAFPELNTLVCDKAGNPCDGHCGGAGCGKCGGISCEGAVTKAEVALEYAQNAHTELKTKDANAEELLRNVTQAKKEVDDAKELAEMAYLETERQKNNTEKLRENLEQIENEIAEFLNQSSTQPHDIRTLAQEVLSQNITLQPEQIEQLANGISDSLAKLNNTEQINKEAGGDLNHAEQMEHHANNAATEATKALVDAVQVRQELEKASSAQNDAEKAIEKAREDISSALTDLSQIERRTTTAVRKGADARSDLNKLKERLEELQKKNLQNERRRIQAKQESDFAFKNATEVQKNAEKLRQEFDLVSGTLESKLKSFEGAQGRDDVQNQATVLANSLNEKLKELTDMENEFKEHERRTGDLTDEINKMGSDIEEHLKVIREHEFFHSNCHS